MSKQEAFLGLRKTRIITPRHTRMVALGDATTRTDVTSKLAKLAIDAVVFDLDETLITHSYSRRIPQVRDDSVRECLLEIRRLRIKLFVASAYVEGEIVPALTYIGEGQGPPKDLEAAELQKRILVTRLLGEDLFEEIRTFPFARLDYATSKVKIFEDVATRFGFEFSRMLAVTDSPEEALAADRIGMKFAHLEEASEAIEKRSKGIASLKLNEIVAPYLYEQF